MRTYRSAILAGVTALLLAAPGWAQTGTTGTTDPGSGGQTGATGTTGTTSGTGTTGTTSTPDPGSVGTTGTTATTPQAPPVGTNSTTDNDEYGNLANEWIASAFVGSNFGSVTSGGNVDFGGNIAYLRNGIGGFEFLAGFSPRFTMNRFLSGDAVLSNYMVNGIVAVPVGTFHAFRPFISAGIGAMTMGLNNNAVLAAGNGSGLGIAPLPNGTITSGSNNAYNSGVFSPNATHFAGDIGIGAMGFVGHWGVRGDLRYFSALGTASTNTTGVTSVTTTSTSRPTDNTLLNRVAFWRANIGVAVRF